MPKLIFISHASRDKEIVKDFVNIILVNALGVDIRVISSSTTNGTKPKSGADWRNSIKDDLISAKITFFIITPNFKKSEVSLNEMGAAWVLSSEVLPFFIEPITYKSVGVMHEIKQVEKLTDAGSLDRLRDIVQEKLEIPTDKIMSDRWSELRDDFLEKVSKYINDHPFDLRYDDEHIPEVNKSGLNFSSSNENSIVPQIKDSIKGIALIILLIGTGWLIDKFFPKSNSSKNKDDKISLKSIRNGKIIDSIGFKGEKIVKYPDAKYDFSVYSKSFLTEHELNESTFVKSIGNRKQINEFTDSIEIDTLSTTICFIFHLPDDKKNWGGLIIYLKSEIFNKSAGIENFNREWFRIPGDTISKVVEFGYKGRLDGLAPVFKILKI